MKKIFYLILFITAFLLIEEVSALCCGDPDTEQCKCFGTGYCCDVDRRLACAIILFEDCDFCHWFEDPCLSPRFYDFKFWVEPTKAMFTLGQKTPINLYIENVGDQVDSYTIDFNIISANPSLIIVEMPEPHPTGQPGITEVRDVSPNEKVIKKPRILILSKEATGDIEFNATLEDPDSPSRTVTLRILESDFPASLPEFNLFGVMGIIIIASSIYFFQKKFSST